MENDELKSAPSLSGTKQNKMKAFATATGGAAVKVFHEFKWGLLTLVLLMAVVITLVWSGNDAKTEDSPVVASAESSQLNFSEKMENAAIIPAPLESIPPPLPGNSVNDWERPSDRSQLPLPRPSALQFEPLPPLEPLLPPPTAPAEFDDGFSTDLSSSGRSQIDKSGSPVMQDETKLYTVEPGDFLEKISRKFYENQVRAGIKVILEANKDQLTSADHLRVGQILKIPALSQPPQSASAVGSSSAATVTSRPTPAVDGEVAVESGDTLERIARRVLGDGRRWAEIYELNRDRIQSPDRLMVGVSLRLPKNAAASSSAEGSVRVEKSENQAPVIAIQDETEGKKGSGAYLSAEELPALLNNRSSSAPAWMP